MSILETIMDEIKGEATVMDKTASSNNYDSERADLLEGLSNSISDDAVTGRINKLASASASVFVKTAAAQFKSALNTDVFIEKLANRIIEKLATETSTEIIPDTVVDEMVASPQNPMKAPVDNIDLDVPAETNQLRAETAKLIESAGISAANAVGGKAPSEAEIAKQAAEMGIDMNVLDEMAEYYMNIA